MLRIAQPLLNSAPGVKLAGRVSRNLTPRLASPLPKRPLLSARAPSALWASYSTNPPRLTRDKAFEKEAGRKTLEANPEQVSSQSSVRHVMEESQAPPPPPDEDVLRSLKDDLHTFEEAFALSSVPREAYALGLAGTVPYLATSIATVILSWDLNTTWPTSSNLVNSFLISHETAAHWLHLLEPIQAGYGAVIVSFLGAIHWGLEFAEKNPSTERTRFRYGLGVLAPAVAWPTVFMPIEWALTAQFMAFTALYLADSRATTRGWAPQWYGTYRWVLTAVVGAAIFISLVGRAKVGQARPRLRTGDLERSIRQKPDEGHEYHNWAKEEAEERARLKKKKEEEEKKKKEEEKEQKKKEKKDEGKKKEKDEQGKEEKQQGNKGEEEENKGENENDKGEKEEDQSDEIKANKEKKADDVQETEKAKKE